MRRGLLGAAVLLSVAVAIVAIASAGLPMEKVQGASQAAAATSMSMAPVPTAMKPSPAPSITALPPATQLVPLVPVVAFWSTQRSLSLLDLSRLWIGTADAFAETHFQSLAVSAAEVDPLARELDLPPTGSLQILSTPDQVKAAVRASSTTLGLLLADEVTPDVRALAVNDVSLFGYDRIKDLAQWPLLVASGTPTTFSARNEWTLAAGGDVNLARGVYTKAVGLGYGPDFPWSGGNAVVSGFEAGGWQGATTVVARDTGPKGALSSRLRDADLALVNLEGPAPNDWVPSNADSLVFTFDPALLAGLRNAGIDAVTLANNHIRNDGNRGVVETCQNLDAAGIAHTGAGEEIAAARQPAWLGAAGMLVAVLGYSEVGRDNYATPDHPGAAPLDPDSVAADIHAARAAGADIVIVMPHWGEEYTYALSSDQMSEAAAFVAAGADLVLGSHSHWVGAVQSIDRPGGPAFVDYSLGDFLFNLNHDYQSQEGVILTLTFSGRRLVQVDLQPTVMIDGAQVGLMDPATDGRAVLDAIHRASSGLLSW
jgi:poly-gamma-glutamate synthesis protein (capsule biosynthesis protein)